MTIKLRYFAWVRERVGILEEDIEVPAGVATVAELMVWLSSHGTTVERVHLHEVGAVDAIVDILGSVWGFDLLGVSVVYCNTISLGDGFVNAAHGLLPVPAPATLRLLEGQAVRPGPENSGELVTPTGAALVRVLSSGTPTGRYVVSRSGYGAGTKEFKGRANALRIVLARSADEREFGVEQLVQLACDIDDMSPEYLAAAADRLRQGGALDVVLIPTLMKKGRPGARLEVLCEPSAAAALEQGIFAQTTTLGVRRSSVERLALPRESREVVIDGHPIRVKVATLPGGTRRAKPEFADVERAALATGGEPRDIFLRAAAEAERG